LPGVLQVLDEADCVCGVTAWGSPMQGRSIPLEDASIIPIRRAIPVNRILKEGLTGLVHRCCRAGDLVALGQSGFGVWKATLECAIPQIIRGSSRVVEDWTAFAETCSGEFRRTLPALECLEDECLCPTAS
jgi:hypothetical protein